MNLEEFRKALSSDATEENAQQHSFDCRRNSGNDSDEAYGGRKC